MPTRDIVLTLCVSLLPSIHVYTSNMTYHAVYFSPVFLAFKLCTKPSLPRKSGVSNNLSVIESTAIYSRALSADRSRILF